MNTTTRRGGCTRRQPCLRARVQTFGCQQRQRSPCCLDQTRTSFDSHSRLDPAFVHSNYARNQIVRARAEIVTASEGVQSVLQALLRWRV